MNVTYYMKHIISTITLLLSLICISTSAQNIELYAPNKANTKVILGQYHGDKIKNLGEKITNTDGYVFFNIKNLSSGIFYLSLSDSIVFEFLYDNRTPGNVKIKYEKKYEITNAPSSTFGYYHYINNENSIANKLDSIRFILKQSDTKKREQKELLLLIDQLNKEKKDNRYKIILEYDTLLIAKLIKSEIKITVPDYQPPETVVNKDSAIWMWQMSYYKKHYLDNLDLAYPDLINTPIYTQKINTFLEKINLQNSNDLISATDFILHRASKDSATAKFTTNYLLIKYSALKNNPEYELVYLHLIKDYYMQGKTPWMTERDINILAHEYNKRLPISLHQISPEIECTNDSDDNFSLHALEAEYTILYFHNYDCELCKTTGKELKQLMYQVDPDAIKTVAICMGKDKKCKDYAKNYHLINWVNIYDEEKMGQIALDYDLSYTPTLYLLDKDKKIISKNLTVRELEKWIDNL